MSTATDTLSVCAAQPVCVPSDVAANVAAHADAVREAGTRLVVFPELSLTGYVLDARALGLPDARLEPLVDACRAAAAVALVGAPVNDGGRAFIAMLRVDADGVAIVYRKRFLGGRELQRFAAGDGAVAIDVDGWRVGLGICKDTGADEHVACTAALDVDLYAAGVVHHPEELGEQDRRGRRIASAVGGPVVMSSAAGAVGPDYAQTAGTSTIFAMDGGVLARATARPGELAIASISRGVPASAA